jgi:hypothetical protein
MALPSDLESGQIHVYAHSEHNHPLLSVGKVMHIGDYKYSNV